MKRPIYLDHHSTTPVSPEVLEAMWPFFSEKFGNASITTHSYGWDAAQAVEKAREQAAALVGCSSKEIVFTSGATESIGLAHLGIANQSHFQGHVISTSTEHKAGLEALHTLEQMGMQATILSTNQEGSVSVEQIQNAVKKDTLLISVIFGNNEIGTLNPIESIGQFCKEKNILFHTDATQTVGKVAVSVERLGVDLLSFSSHKIYGPKGVGALYVRRKNPRVRLKTFFKGGGQELGLRGGTLNVSGIVGFGHACQLALNSWQEESAHTSHLRDRFFHILKEKLGDQMKLNGPSLDPQRRLPHNLNVTFQGVPTQAILAKLHQDMAISTGSSCSGESGEPSHVLKAIGLTEEDIRSTLRFGFGRSNTPEDIEFAAQRILEVISQLS